MDIDDIELLELLDTEFSLRSDAENGKRTYVESTVPEDRPGVKRARSGVETAEQNVRDFEDEIEDLLHHAYNTQQKPSIDPENSARAAASQGESGTLRNSGNSTSTQLDSQRNESTFPQERSVPGTGLSHGSVRPTVSLVGIDVARGLSYEYIPPAKSSYRILGKQIEVTSETGQRAYCAVAEAVLPTQRVINNFTRCFGNRQQLLSRPINDMMEELEQELYERLGRGATAGPSSSTQVNHRSSQSIQEAGLWVQKYSPKSFLELLSNAKVNREVLKWLKSWDQCVFGVSAGQPRKQLSAKPAQPTDNRPEHKVILITGPPGLGKTTLAHVVAAICGYRGMEINASDDRSGSSLAARLESAVRMTSVIGDKRPNCVIVDEIDGAMGGAEGRSGIAALIKMVQAGGATGNTAEDSEEGSKKKPRKAEPLRRPIICICNDLYAPALRPLRDVAKVFHVRKPTVERLVTRLQWICQQEKLTADRQALTWLAEESDCDIRTCLNSLQWIAGRKQRLRFEDLKGMNVGTKDMTNTAFDMWNRLFQKQGSRSRYVRGSEQDTTSSLHSALVAFGEMELMRDGLHENLYNAKYFDSDLRRTSGVLDLLGDTDAMLRYVHKRMDFSLHQGVAACLLSIRNQVAGHERVELQWPRQHQHKQLTANRQLLSSWMSTLPSNTFVAMDKCSAVQDVIPSLLWSLSPAVRPVAAALRTPEERSAICRVVDTMLAYAVRYSLSEEGEEGQEATSGPVKLIPALDTLVHFKGMPQCMKAVPLATRRLLEHEADLHRIQQRQEAAPVSQQPLSGPSGSRPSSGATSKAAAAATRESILGRGAAATSVGGSIKNKPSLSHSNWLTDLHSKGTAKGQSSKTAGGAAGKPQFAVLYKFHEGYTNAVKRPMLMKHLM